MTAAGYQEIVTFCESCLDLHGDTHRGVGWTKEPETALRRNDVMLGVILPDVQGPVSVLDFGCGASHLYDHILRRSLRHVNYSGLDLSERFLSLSRSKHPDITYYNLDILKQPAALPDFDYVILSGIFTMKGRMSQNEMLEYFRSLLTAAFRKARVGIAFNVMSKLVDWERDDLFHLSFDTLAEILRSNLSRHFVIHHDYRLFEYSVYVYR